MKLRLPTREQVQRVRPEFAALLKRQSCFASPWEVLEFARYINSGKVTGTSYGETIKVEQNEKPSSYKKWEQEGLIENAGLVDMPSMRGTSQVWCFFGAYFWEGVCKADDKRIFLDK